VEGRLVAALVDLALSDPSIKALDTAAEMIGRSRVRDDAALALLGAARMLQDGRRDQALDLLTSLPASTVLDSERWRLELIVQAAVDGPADTSLLEPVRAEVEAWAAARPGAAARACLHRWRSRLIYREGRMADAGREAEAGAAHETVPFDRLRALLAAATAWIEAGDVERTLRISREARELAARLRLPRLEARAEWLTRSIENRTGSARVPDIELADAARELDAPHIEGLIAVTEAAIAWRHGLAEAHSLAACAGAAFGRAGYAAAAMFARAIEIASGPPDPRAARGLAEAACAAGRPDVAVEVLGVLARSGQLSGDWRDAFEAQRRVLPVQNPDWRSGALSLNEASAAVTAAAGSGRRNA
jgi:hypothetical protein